MEWFWQRVNEEMMRDEDSLIVFPLQALITRYKIEDFFFFKEKKSASAKNKEGTESQNYECVSVGLVTLSLRGISGSRNIGPGRYEEQNKAHLGR